MEDFKTKLKKIYTNYGKNNKNLLLNWNGRRQHGQYKKGGGSCDIGDSHCLLGGTP